MGRNFIIFLMMVLINSVALSQEKKVKEEGYIVSVGDKAPDFMISEAGGNTYRLSDLRGKVVMLQFTASWCSVCRTEMPFIEKEIWKTKKAEGLVVIGIDRDEPVEKVLAFKKRYSYNLPAGAGSRSRYFRTICT